jgi:hypothetical protein
MRKRRQRSGRGGAIDWLSVVGDAIGALIEALFSW